MTSFPLWCLHLIRELCFGTYGAVLCLGSKLAMAVFLLNSSSSAEVLTHSRPIVLGLAGDVLWYLGAYIARRIITSRASNKLALS
jgi:hypothetical protein